MKKLLLIGMVILMINIVYADEYTITTYVNDDCSAQNNTLWDSAGGISYNYAAYGANTCRLNGGATFWSIVHFNDSNVSDTYYWNLSFDVSQSDSTAGNFFLGLTDKNSPYNSTRKVSPANYTNIELQINSSNFSGSTSMDSSNLYFMEVLVHTQGWAALKYNGAVIVNTTGLNPNGAWFLSANNSGSNFMYFDRIRLDKYKFNTDDPGNVTGNDQTIVYIDEKCNSGLNKVTWTVYGNWPIGGTTCTPPVASRNYGAAITKNTYTFLNTSDPTTAMNLSYTFWRISTADVVGNMTFPGFGANIEYLDRDVPRLSLNLSQNNSASAVKLDNTSSSEIIFMDFTPNLFEQYRVNHVMYGNCSIITDVNGTLFHRMDNCDMLNTPFYISFGAEVNQTAITPVLHYTFDDIVLWQNYTNNPNVEIAVYDENNDSLINYTTTTFNFIKGDTVNWNFSTANGTLNVNISAGDWEIRYRPGNHTERSYYLTIENVTLPNTLTLYSLLNSSGTYPIVIKVLDETATELPNARVQALRYFPNSSTPYKLVLMKETNENGDAAIDLELFDASYKFQVIYNDEVKLRDGPTEIYQLSWRYYISTQAIILDNFKKWNSINYFMEYLNDSQLMRLEWTDTQSILAETCLDVYQVVNTEESQVCSNCSSAIAGILYCSVTDDNKTTYISKARFSTNNPSIFVDTLIVNFLRAFEIFGNDGLLLTGFIFVGCAAIGLTVGPIVGMILGLFALFLMSVTGLITLTWTAFSSLIVIFIIGAILIIRRRGIL